MSKFDLSNPFEGSDLRSLMWKSKGIFKDYLFWRIISVIVVVPFPIITQQVIDKGLSSKDIVLCLQLASVSLTLLSLHIFAMIKAVRLLATNSQALTNSMRGRIFGKLQFMHFGFLDSTQTGRLLSKYAFDTQNVEMAMVPMVSSVIPELFRSALLICALAFLNPWLLLFVSVALPPVIIVRVVFMRRLRLSNECVRRAREKLTGHANEFISAIRLVRGFGQEKPVEANMDSISGNYSERRRIQMELNQTFGWVVFSLFACIEILAIACGSVLVLHDQLTLGTLVALVGSLPVILAPAQLLAQFNLQYMQGQEAYRSIKELVDSGYVEQWKGKRMPENLLAKIELRNVSFKYDRAERYAIRDMSLTIESGKHVAFVGASGSGKSTMVNLILGLYPATSGEICIDGVPQEDLAIRAFRRHCAIVMQDNLLISGSVADNLRFAKPNATKEEVIHAAKVANAWDFIQDMPQGLETKVGERGVALSGGQRQRIAIARAVLRDPVMLILDEATSALDNESEHIVQEALERIAKNRTTITIAHRLSTVRKADLIVVLNQGEVIEMGTYQELAAKSGGAFADLLAMQEH
ncbi:ABC transporter ATP-binding protein [Cerasicoccus arenae]|uniref:Putative multidrug export ATP-binding/permease protein n=1 Tax=Cerasicoccus arenae TaxID=424488 RepID=A0A8J3DGT5_9BACT|nr:ABC transporter ATP-binding protein [Cerasicoccus arenae]MBK1858015.1 ABC transporter ATP-binding protein [Cerasicoccus arenae]GHB97455.1 putative multidrug export ATP-binding/permease protein [Cerasicoccus arenae]